MADKRINLPTILALVLGFAGIVYAFLWHVRPEVAIPIVTAYLAMMNQMKPAFEKKRDRTKRERSTDRRASNPDFPPPLTRDTKP